jgi:hypothetical protein
MLEKVFVGNVVIDGLEVRVHSLGFFGTYSARLSRIQAFK